MEMLCDNGYGAGGIVEALNAKIYGNGTETLVLSHGYGLDQTVWHYLLPYLACYFKVVVFDLIISPNVNPKLYDPNKYSSFEGYSQDLMCLLDRLNVSNTIYMGHSMSAMIGCLAATKRPELFQHIILLNGSPRYLDDEGYDGGFKRPELDSIFENIKDHFWTWVPNFVPHAVGINNTEAIKEFEYSLGRMNPKIALSAAETVFLSDLRWVLPKVSVPCTIIQSQNDIIVTQFVPFYMKRELSGPARVKILKAKGHFPQLTAYHLLWRVLKKALHIKRYSP